MSELLDSLARRRATRAFDLRPVSPEIEALLWRAVSVAPSHGNSQPSRIVVARSAETRAKLAAALSEGNRGWANAAPLLAVLAILPHDAPQKNSDGTQRELGLLHGGIALGNLLAQATASGLVAHPMAGFDEQAVRTALSIPEDARVAAVLAIGYPGDPGTLPDDLAARETMPQERIPLGMLVAEDAWHPDQSTSARELRKRAQA